MCISEGMIREEVRQRAEKFRADFLGLGMDEEWKIHRENEGWILRTCVCEGYEPKPFVEHYYNLVRYDEDKK